MVFSWKKFIHKGSPEPKHMYGSWDDDDDDDKPSSSKDQDRFEIVVVDPCHEIKQANKQEKEHDKIEDCI